ncbi:hypothetical protein GCM10027053_47700 [Intrasporangium mesophilum]
MALSNGRVLDAWAAAQTLVRQYRPSQNLDELRQREDGLVVLQHWCNDLEVNPHPTVLELARDVPVRDSMMAFLIAQYADALLPNVQQGAKAMALSAVLDPTAWPLTFSLVHEIDGDLDAAVQTLPSDNELTGLDLLWRNQIARTRQMKPGAEFTATIKKGAVDLLADVATSDITFWPEWQRSAFSRAISLLLLLGEASGLDDELAHALTRTRQEIAGEYGEDSHVDVIRNLAIAKKLTSGQ